jgi:acyl carrier protein
MKPESAIAAEARAVVRELASNDCGPFPQDGYSLREQLGYNSLTLATLMFRLQDSFGVPIGSIQSRLFEAGTVEDVVSLVTKHSTRERK